MTGLDAQARVKVGSRLKLYHSTNHGKTWAKQDVTPANPGSSATAGSTSRRMARIGVGYETHADINGNWHVYAGISPRFGSPVTYALR